MKWPAQFISLLLLTHVCAAQQQAYNFHQLGLEEGLHDGTVRFISQDKYGYIWIGSLGALNRFDGREIVQFSNIPCDSTSPYASVARCMYSDPHGRLWIGYETGLLEYNFKENRFRRIPSLKNYFVGHITSFNDSTLFITSGSGLIRYNTFTGHTFFYGRSKLPQHAALFENGVSGFTYKNNKLYLATKKGLVIFYTNTDAAEAISIPAIAGIPLYTLDVDADENIWMGAHLGVKLVKLHADLKHLEIYDQFLSSEKSDRPILNVMQIMVDRHNTVWVATNQDGLLQYMPATNKMIKHLHNGSIPSSPASNSYRTIFQDDKNIIWLGTDYFGVTFFEPGKLLFQTILPLSNLEDEMSKAVGRAITEDKQGNLWMGNHYGMYRYDINTRQYTGWQNKKGKERSIYNNYVRTAYCDADNNVWFGTGSGVNKYISKTNSIEFISTNKLPSAFYNFITEDRSGNIWFCLNADNGLWWYDIKKKTYHNITGHPQLKDFSSLGATSYVFEDSHGRLWISFTGNGVVMLDKKTGETRHLVTSETDSNSLIGNLVIEIKEDRKSIIWMTTFNGLSAYDPDKNKFRSFNKANGLPGNLTCALAIDSMDRIWVGANGGLAMLDTGRTIITRFSTEDGLPSIGFTAHAGMTTANGDIIFPGNHGYVRFNPLRYKNTSPLLRFYIGSYSVFDKTYAAAFIENDHPGIQLKASDNSFTFNLIAINYLNPHQTWFAYKLEGFDKSWHYTQDAKAVYTNIPGGHYTFQYKASTNNENWENIVAKGFDVQLQTVFYKTFWFWLILASLVILALQWFYRLRLSNQRQIMGLQTKADALQREKTAIQYESLKQHLNPHFLFNSLTSLRSLIKTDSKTATRFLDGLSKVYRYVLKSDGQDLVLVRDEIEFVKTFADLQKTRFGEGLLVFIEVDETAMQKFVAPVILQNMLENAIKHNTTDIESPLVIEIFTTDEYIIVRNNLQRYKSVETSNKRGLISLQKLYGFFTDKQILIEEDDHYYTTSIPLL